MDTATTINLGTINHGQIRTLTFTFQQKLSGTWTTTPPSGGAHLAMTKPGSHSEDITTQLVDEGGGAWSFVFRATVNGTWTGTAYAPEGTGEDSQPFTITVVADPNRP